MARLTARDYVNDVKLALGGTDDSLVSETQLLRWINAAYQLDVAASYDFAELDATETKAATASQAYIDLVSTDVMKIKEITDTTNDVLLREINRSYYDELIQGGADTGNAVFWFQAGVSSSTTPRLYLWPTPDSADSFTISYKKKPADLVLLPTPTSTILPDLWDDVITAFAVVRGARFTGAKEALAIWREELKPLVAKAMDASLRSMAVKRILLSPVLQLVGSR